MNQQFLPDEMIREKSPRYLLKNPAKLLNLVGHKIQGQYKKINCIFIY